jgi:hypothetical protein
MGSIILVIFLVIMLMAYAVVMIYIPNRSRCSLEQAVRISGCPESELHKLIQEGYLIVPKLLAIRQVNC